MPRPNPAKLKIFSVFVVIVALLVNGFFYKLEQDFYHLTFLEKNVKEAPGLITDKQRWGKKSIITVAFLSSEKRTRNFTTTVGNNEPYEAGDRVIVVYDDTGERMYAMLEAQKSAGWFIVGLGAFIFLMFSYASLKTVAQARRIERK